MISGRANAQPRRLMAFMIDSYFLSDARIDKRAAHTRIFASRSVLAPVDFDGLLDHFGSLGRIASLAMAPFQDGVGRVDTRRRRGLVVLHHGGQRLERLPREAFGNLAALAVCAPCRLR